MAKDNLTFKLEGEIQISDFAKAINSLNRLIGSLTREIAGGSANIEWVVTELEGGSASTTITGYADNPENVYSVIEGYKAVGKALESNRPVPYSEPIRKEAEKLRGILSEQVSAMRFSTADDEAVIAKEEVEHSAPSTAITFGAIEGRVQTLTERQGLKFTLFDTLYDKPVNCYLDSERQNELREIWGKRAIIEGMVKRNAKSGRPLSIRHISDIREVAEVEPGAFRRVRGVLKLDEPAEKVIRRVRDAW